MPRTVDRKLLRFHDSSVQLHLQQQRRRRHQQIHSQLFLLQSRRHQLQSRSQNFQRMLSLETMVDEINTQLKTVMTGVWKSRKIQARIILNRVTNQLLGINRHSENSSGNVVEDGESSRRNGVRREGNGGSGGGGGEEEDESNLGSLQMSRSLSAPTSSPSSSLTSMSSLSVSPLLDNSPTPSSQSTSSSSSSSSSSAAAISLSLPPSEDEGFDIGPSTLSQSPPAPPSSLASSYSAMEPTLSDLYSQVHRTYAARFNSFEHWPISMHQRPNELSEAGFFYIGLGDKVKCFACGGGLERWDATDRPWVEHARFFGETCSFVRACKDPEFITAALALNSSAASAPSETVSTATKISTSLTPPPPPPQPQEQQQPPPQLPVPDILINLVNENHNVCSGTKTKKNYTSCCKNASSTNRHHLRNRCCGCCWIRDSTDDNESTSQKRETSNQKNNNIPLTTTLPPSSDVATSTTVNINTATTTKQKSNIASTFECKICQDQLIEMVFMPCGHAMTCTMCAFSCITCPICRKTVESRLRVFIG